MDPVIGVVLAAVLGALGSYLAAARKLSGKVATSDATELWAESRSIREWSAERIAELQQEIDEMEARLREVEQQKTDLVSEKHTLLDTIADLRAELRSCRSACEYLTHKLHGREHGGETPPVE